MIPGRLRSFTGIPCVPCVSPGQNPAAPRVGVWHIGTLRPIVESHTRQVARAAFTGTLQCVVWLWMAWKNKSGRAWARVLSTIAFGLSCIATPLDLGTGAIESRILGVVIWLVGFAATIQLWRPESGPFYRRQVHRPSSEATYPSNR
jgi:hypothetical protein